MPLITDSQLLKSAHYVPSGSAIPCYDDGWGQLYILRDTTGILGIARAEDWQAAYEIAEDEFFLECDMTVAELEAEYGSAWIDDACFQESYGFRPNGPNVRDKLQHGIYAHDLNGEYLEPLTAELIEELGIALEIENDEEVSCAE